MDRRFKLSLLAAAVAATQFSGAAFNGASAADLLPPPPVIEVPEVVQKSSSGWYLRGDISYDFQESHGVHAINPAGLTPLRSYDVDDSYNIGLGLGYQISNHFRVDATVEHIFDASFHGGTVTSCNGGVDNCYSTEETEFSKTKLMANAYVDLAHIGGLTPYIGAGIGGAYVKYDDIAVTDTCVAPGPAYPNPATHPPCPTGVIPNPNSYSIDGDGAWRFAWALHAGASYNVSHNVKLDLGYTFSRIEGGKMGGSNSGGVYTQYDDKGFTDHTVRAGLRYTFH